MDTPLGPTQNAPLLRCNRSAVSTLLVGCIRHFWYTIIDMQKIDTGLIVHFDVVWQQRAQYTKSRTGEQAGGLRTQMMGLGLKGKVALVTGGSKGLDDRAYSLRCVNKDEVQQWIP